jgi:thiopeptide-type bacteriocin biosynthesis protein
MSVEVLQAADFFVIRAPRSSLSQLRKIPTEPTALVDFLASWLATPAVQEALYLASPSLMERLPNWQQQPNSKAAIKITNSLLKYFVRFSSRATPFGLFAGVALGQVANETHLQCNTMLRDKRHTRFDIAYLAAIRAQFSEPNEAEKWPLLCYQANPTLQQQADGLHYIEPYFSDTEQKYRLSTLVLDEYLLAMLQLTKKGGNFASLQDGFQQLYPTANAASIQDYIKQLLAAGVLQVKLPLALTSGSPDQTFITALQSMGATDSADILQRALTQLNSMDKQPVNSLKRYQEIYRGLQTLPYPVSENRLLQTDILRSFSQCQLAQAEVSALMPALLALLAMRKPYKTPLNDFSQKFEARFSSQYVPLLTLLDDEVGISFSSDIGYHTSLLAGLNITNRSPSSQDIIEPLQQTIIAALSHVSPSETVLQLTSDSLLSKHESATLMAKLPASFAINLSAYQQEDGRVVYYYHGCYGPSAANLLGRFCHLSTDMLQQVKQHLSQEEAHSPEVIFAEVLHMPEGRPGNVIARPTLRAYEIVFLADSHLANEWQIPISDLLVYQENNVLCLWSQRLQKRIIPRLSSAHNFSDRSLGIYRFLCSLQHQNLQMPHFSLPDSLYKAKRVPRIMLDNLVLQEAHCNIPVAQLKRLWQEGQFVESHWLQLQQEYGLERYMSYAIADHVLLIDLQNNMMFQMLLAEVNHKSHIRLNEVLAMKYQPLLQGPDGPYQHEIIVPLSNSAAIPYLAPLIAPLTSSTNDNCRQFAPGSEWLSVKLYAGQSSVEQLLLKQLAPWLTQMQQDGVLKHWFFIRYGDPDWHLRLRCFGEPERLHGELLPALNRLLAPSLASAGLHRIELFTYMQETERYGGEHMMPLAEHFFCLDSQFVLQAILFSQQDDSLRWRLAILAIDLILTQFDYLPAEKFKLIDNLRTGFAQEFKEGLELRQQMGDKYRYYQSQLQQDRQLLDWHNQAIEPFKQQIQQSLQQFSSSITPCCQAMLALFESQQAKGSRDSLLGSLLHMFTNRLFKAYGREQEFVVYDMLRRIYLSQRAQPVRGLSQ